MDLTWWSDLSVSRERKNTPREGQTALVAGETVARVTRWWSRTEKVGAWNLWQVPVSPNRIHPEQTLMLLQRPSVAAELGGVHLKTFVLQ